MLYCTLILIAMLHGGRQSELQGSDAVYRFDLMEINHCYDESGKLRYTQVMCMNWKPDYRRFNVEFWTLIENTDSPRNRPVVVDHFYSKPQPRWRYQFRFRHSTGNAMIYSQMLRETKTVRDPERDDKQIWPQENRCGLNTPYRSTLLR